jgi:muconolactone D-isomerase
MQYLVTMTTHVPDGVSAEEVDDVRAREAQAAESRSDRKLADQGYLVRLWGLPGPGRALGLWQAEGAGELEALLAALPLRPWLEIETVPLTGHPNDPAGTVPAGTGSTGGAR